MGEIKELKIIVNLLDSLYDLSSNKWRNSKDIFNKNIPQSTITNYEVLSGIYYPEKIDKEKMRTEIDENKIINLEEKFFLPPLDYDKEFIPIMGINADYDTEPHSFDIRVGLYRYENGDYNKLQGFGYRFERHPGGNHSYFHAQLTKKPHTLIQKYETPKWIAEHLPCLVIPAENAVSLLFTVLISFYGKEIARNFVSAQNVDGKYKIPLRFALNDE